MKLYIPKTAKADIGGGITFLKNFIAQAAKFGLEVTHDGIADYDLLFVANPMHAERIDFSDAKAKGKPIVLRTDNIPEDWNNRGTAISKLRDFIGMADRIIYQSRWAKEKYLEFGAGEGKVIHNGVDCLLHTPSGEQIADTAYPRLLYVKSSRNENKRYPEAMEMFRRYWQTNKKSKLFLVGKFADDLHKYNFGFYNGENYQYLGIFPPEQMPMIYRSAEVLLFPAYADCFPNCVLEAMSCGVVPIIHPYGGAAEMIQSEDGTYGRFLDYVLEPNEVIEEALAEVDRVEMRKHIVDNFSIEKMMEAYHGEFVSLSN